MHKSLELKEMSSLLISGFTIVGKFKENGTPAAAIRLLDFFVPIKCFIEKDEYCSNFTRLAVRLKSSLYVFFPVCFCLSF